MYEWWWCSTQIVFCFGFVELHFLNVETGFLTTIISHIIWVPLENITKEENYKYVKYYSSYLMPQCYQCQLQYSSTNTTCTLWRNFGTFHVATLLHIWSLLLINANASSLSTNTRKCLYNGIYALLCLGVFTPAGCSLMTENKGMIQ